MQTLKPGADASVLVSKPVKPPAVRLVARISALLADMSDVREAHLPAMLALGSATTPDLVLYVVAAQAGSVDGVRTRVEAALVSALSARKRPTLWVVPPDHALLATVRAADCVVGWRD